MAPKLDPFFPAIGSLADQTSQAPEVADSDTRLDGPQLTRDDDDDREVQEIESLCMTCHEQGVTRLLLTSIPYFREVVVMSFRCEHCGNSNTEIQSAGMIQERGSIYTAHIRTAEDFDRQLVKSPTCTITIPEFSLTIPPNRGQLTNVEGILRDTLRDLEMDQPVRKVMDPETWGKIEGLLQKLKEALGDEERRGDEKTWEGGLTLDQKAAAGSSERPDRDDVKRRKVSDAAETHAAALAAGQTEKTFAPFTITLDDPAGNSWIQFLGSIKDPKWTFRQYLRSKEQDEAIGLSAPTGDEGGSMEAIEEEGGTVKKEGQPSKDEIFSFPSICSSCGSALETLMKKVNIPYFQDIIIMSTNCFSCGYKDNEVKSGGAVSEQGKRIILKVDDAEDLSRDLLKSETCGLEIPEIDLVLQPGTLGGRFTTLEGILTQVYEELSDKVFASSGGGDAGPGVEVGGFEKFLQDLKEVMGAEKEFTLILDDPLANSYLQNPYAPDADPNMKIESYSRTFDQNEELGLNDMVVEGYDGEKEAAQARGEHDENARKALLPQVGDVQK